MDLVSNSISRQLCLHTFVIRKASTFNLYAMFVGKDFYLTLLLVTRRVSKTNTDLTQRMIQIAMYYCGFPKRNISRKDIFLMTRTWKIPPCYHRTGISFNTMYYFNNVLKTIVRDIFLFHTSGNFLQSQSNIQKSDVSTKNLSLPRNVMTSEVLEDFIVSQRIRHPVLEEFFGATQSKLLASSISYCIIKIKR